MNTSSIRLLWSIFFSFAFSLSVTSSARAEVCEREDLSPGEEVEGIEPGWELEQIEQWTKEIELGDHSLTLVPTVNAKFKRGRRIINLSEAVASGHPLHIRGAARNRGYRVEDRFEISATVGANGEIEKLTGAESKLTPFVGLAPMAGRSFSSSRTVLNRKQAQSLPRLSAPVTVRTLDQLRPGDSLSYAASGGIVFWAGFGVDLFEVEVVYVARGDFEVEVEKENSDKVIVSVVTQKLKSLGVEKGVLIAEAGVEDYRRIARTLSFSLHLGSPEGAWAFEKILNGDIQAAQKLIARGSKAIQPLTRKKIQTVGHNAKFEISLPLVFEFEWKKGRFFERHLSRNLVCGVKQRAVYSAYLNSSEKSFLNLVDKSEVVMFYGVAHRTQAPSGRIAAKGLFGEMVIQIEDDHATSNSVRAGLDKIRKLTGIEAFALMTVPKTAAPGFAAIEVKMRMGAEQTRRLLRIENLERAQLLSRARQAVKGYLAKGGDQDGLCSDMPREFADQGVNEAEACYRFLVAETTTSIELMKKGMVALRQAIKSNQAERATRAYAVFGEGLMKNRFAMELATAIAGPGITLEFELKGAEFSQHQLQFQSNASGGFALAAHRAR